MSRSGAVTLMFAGEKREFRLDIERWEKIQEKCDAGPAELLARLSPMFMATSQGLKVDQIMSLGLVGTWRANDIRETIFQGLLGGGTPMPTVHQLVKENVDERPWLESVAVAYGIVKASIFGPEDEDAAGESEAAPEKAA